LRWGNELALLMWWGRREGGGQELEKEFRKVKNA
jgi:hypothetical protein